MAAKFVLISAVLMIAFQEIHGHGKLMDPVNRSSAWRKGYKTPPNYTDNENFCGGFGVQQSNGGKCGPCGDNYRNPQPRANENGGVYGTGTIVKTYKSGQNITAVVNLSANHMGTFEFAICPLKGSEDIETEECFNAHPVKLADGSRKFQVGRRRGDISIELQLPKHLTCEHCTFRWHYRTANSWGICPGGRGKVGCGPQEQFRSCSDITIQKNETDVAA